MDVVLQKILRIRVTVRHSQISLQMKQVQIQKRIRRIHQTAVHQMEKRWWYIIPQQEIPKQWQITLQMLQEEIYLSWSR